MVFALQALGADQLVEEGFVGQVGFGGFSAPGPRTVRQWLAIRRLRSINGISAWRSAVGGLPTQQTIVGNKIEHWCPELRHLLHSGRADEVTYGIAGRAERQSLAEWIACGW